MKITGLDRRAHLGEVDAPFVDGRKERLPRSDLAQKNVRECARPKDADEEEILGEILRPVLLSSQGRAAYTWRWKQLRISSPLHASGGRRNGTRCPLVGASQPYIPPLSTTTAVLQKHRGHVLLGLLFLLQIDPKCRHRPRDCDRLGIP